MRNHLFEYGLAVRTLGLQNVFAFKGRVDYECSGIFPFTGKNKNIAGITNLDRLDGIFQILRSFVMSNPMKRQPIMAPWPFLTGMYFVM